ncbi:LuxR C-terminal-related transcriptional regulator [Longispora albida]|uniref:LuxR C-terminal-related transcriptional regulator n=1 Tax=Longispora albida TaxID=203523 RepID=UPI00036764D9|nr:LuxR family transcriptional regulator [Longispora albida]
MEFAGRERELAVLGRLASATLDGHFRLGMVGGPAGCGKSRLIGEFAATATGFRIARGVCASGAPPLWPLRGILSGLGRPVPVTEDPFLYSAQLRALTVPALAVLEDAHLADPGTVSVLRLLAGLADLPLLVLAAHRDEPLPVTGPGVVTVQLGGLDAQAAGQYVRGMLDHAPPATVLAELHRRTEGNPRLLAEVVPQLDRDGALHGGTGRLPIRWPAAFREPAQLAIARVLPAHHAVLAAAAVIGREFDLSILERVAGDALPALDAGVEAGLLRQLPREVYAFRQAVIREVLYDTLPAGRRATLHEAVADALTELSGDTGDRAPTLAELAHHLVAAAVPGGAQRLDRAISSAVLAGQATQGAEAVAQFGEAVRLAVRAGWARGQLARLMLALGRAQYSAAEPCRETLDAAARHARHAGDHDLLGLIALSHGPRASHGDTAPPRDEALVALLREVPGPAAQARLAIELGEEPPAGLTGCEGLLARHAADARLAYAVSALHQAAGPLQECRARLALATSQFGLGAVQPAIRELATVAGLPLTDPAGRWWAAQARAHHALLTGAPETGDLIEAAFDLGTRVSGPAAELGRIVQLAALHIANGTLAELPSVLRVPSPQPPWFTALSALIAARRGEHALASALVESTLEDHSGSLWTAVLLLEAAALTGHEPAVARLSAALAGHAHRWVVIGPAVSSAGPVAGYLARCAPRPDPGWPALAASMTAGTPWAPRQAPIAGLTRREREVLALAVAGDSARDIAARLFIGERTVETHLANIYRKAGVRSRVELLALYVTAPGA